MAQGIRELPPRAAHSCVLNHLQLVAVRDRTLILSTAALFFVGSLGDGLVSIDERVLGGIRI